MHKSINGDKRREPLAELKAANRESRTRLKITRSRRICMIGENNISEGTLVGFR